MPPLLAVKERVTVRRVIRRLLSLLLQIESAPLAPKKVCVCSECVWLPPVCAIPMCLRQTA